MSNKKTLLSIAVAAGLGVVSLQASAAAPTVYGDLSFAFVYTGASTDPGDSSYGLSDNVSLLGVKGEAAKIGTTSYFYDFNFILDGGSPATHLAVVGADGDFGKVSLGSRVNGLFVGMVDGGTYLTNWYYTPGMSALQVSNGVTYESKESGGFKFGVQAFDIGKSTESTTNYTVAGTYAMGSLTFGLGYTSYSDYGDGVTQYSASTDTDQFGSTHPTNTFSGATLKSTTGISAAYKADKYGVVLAYDMRKPNDGNANTNTINTAMLTGSYSVSPKTTLVANYSNTDQSGGVKGSVITLMASYAAADSLLYTFEIQSSDKDANVSGLTGATGAGGTKSNTGFAAGVIYNF
jgi:predicted porin